MPYYLQSIKYTLSPCAKYRSSVRIKSKLYKSEFYVMFYQKSNYKLLVKLIFISRFCYLFVTCTPYYVWSLGGLEWSEHSPPEES